MFQPGMADCYFQFFLVSSAILAVESGPRMLQLFEPVRVLFGADNRSIVHGYGELRLHHPCRLSRLFRVHHICSAHWEKGDVWFESLHLRNGIRVAGVIDSHSLHSDYESHLSIFFRMEDLSTFTELS